MFKRFRKSIIVTSVFLVALTLVAFGQIIAPLPVPVRWATQDNLNWFGLTQSAVPTVRKDATAIVGVGTNTFTGITTNLAVNVQGGSNQLSIVNGLVVGAPGL